MCLCTLSDKKYVHVIWSVGCNLPRIKYTKQLYLSSTEDIQSFLKEKFLMPMFAVIATEAWLANRNRWAPFMRFHIPMLSLLSRRKCTCFSIDCESTIWCYYAMMSAKMQISSSQQAATKQFSDICVSCLEFLTRVHQKKNPQFTPCEMKKTHWAAETLKHCWNTRVLHVLVMRNIRQDVTNTYMKHTSAT